jgi:hypothetical protein
MSGSVRERGFFFFFIIGCDGRMHATCPNMGAVSYTRVVSI